MSSLAIHLFGSFTVQLDQVTVDTFATVKARALLAYLAIEGIRPLERSHLANLLWPDDLAESARGNLRYTLSNLRKVIGDQQANPPFLLATRRTLQLHPDALVAGTIAVDVTSFQTLCEQTTTNLAAAQDALALYQAPFLDNSLLVDSPDFDRWVQLQQEQLHRQMADLLTTGIEQSMAANAYSEALPYAQQLVDHEPWHEEAHRRLMNVFWHNGQADAAMRHYETCCRLLREELEVEPSAETVALYETIRNNRHAFQPTAPLQSPAQQSTRSIQQETQATTAQLPIPQTPISPLDSTKPQRPEDAPAPQHNIPPLLKSFIGRERELHEIAERFASPHCRLLTMIGPGGMGKTQLALEYARRAMADLADGVWFVALTGVADSTQIASTIIQVLGVQMTPNQDPQTRLCHFLRDRTLLLVLDNFEHLLDGALLIPELLNAAPNIAILVTSRERLNLQAETVFVLSGLDLPALVHSDAEPEQIMQTSSAVALFVDCAQRADASFTLTDDIRSAVAEICYLTDGMPLGIELAAVWTRLLSCQEILENLQRSIDLLSVSMPDMPARHRSMRALIEESWQNLSVAAQQMFARASIFRGGCDWPALQAVAEASIFHVAELVDRGFLRRVADGSYQIHELMRQFGAEKLALDPTIEAAVAQRHADYYLHFMQQMEYDLVGNAHVDAIQRIVHTIENIHTAWQWALDQRADDLLEIAAEGLFTYYETQGLAYEGEAFFNHATTKLAAGAGRSIPLLVRLRNYLGACLEGLGRFKECQQLLTQNASQAREHQLLDETGWALLRLGNVTAWNDVEEAKPLFEESHSLFQHTENTAGIIASLGSLWYFVLIRQEDKEPALAAVEEALFWSRDLDAPFRIANNLARAGTTHHRLGNFAQARTYTEEALALSRLLKNRHLEAQLLNNLGTQARDNGDYQQSLVYMEESTQLLQQLGLENGVALIIRENLGRLALTMEQWETARIHLLETAIHSQRANNNFLRGRCLEGLAFVLVQLGEYPQARAELQTAIAVDDLWAMAEMRAAILETLILLLLAEEQYEIAANFFSYKVEHYPEQHYHLFDRDTVQVTLATILDTQHNQMMQTETPSTKLRDLIDAVL